MKSKKLLLLAFSFSIVLSAMIIYLLPPLAKKYHLRILHTTHTNENKKYIYYVYLDDSESVFRINAIYNIVNEADILLYNNKNQIVNDIPLQGHFNNFGGRLFFYDTDHDRKKEIYAFTISNDTLWLHIIRDFRSRPVDVKHVMISRVNQTNSFEDYKIMSATFADFDKDNIDDFIFIVAGAYSLQPRKIYLYNSIRDTVYSSPDFATFSEKLSLADNNKDGFPEVYLRTSAPYNFDTLSTYPYLDNSAWLMVLDNHLKFIFPPIEKNGYTSFYQALPFHSGTRPVVASLDGCRSESDTTYHVSLVSYSGKIIRQKKIVNSNEIPYSQFMLDAFPNDLFLVLNNGIAKYDSMLQLTRVSKFNSTLLYGPLFISDLNGNGKKEVLFFSGKNNSLLVLNQKLQKLAKVTLPTVDLNFIPYFNSYTDINGHHVFRLGLGYTNLLMEFTNNPYFFLDYFIYAGIFLLIFISLLMLLKAQNAATLARYEKEKRLIQLQFQTLKNQMDPHFTFNAINSLGSLIYTEKKEIAYDYLVVLSRLIRDTINSSDKVARSLKDELDFTRTYLDLQRYRLKDKMEYEIKVGKDVDVEIKVPRMVIQTHVENALKHGLMNLRYKGILKIDIKNDSGTLIIEISDNGIGREKARELNKDSTKKGITVTEQFYTLINKFSKTKIHQEIVDLFDKDGKPAGTKVIIHIPTDINYDV